MNRPAHFAEPLENGAARCGLCPKRCVVKPGEYGKCLTRHNRAGTLEAITYGRLRAAALDPVEKKPLFHYRPGSTTFSIASAGCNLVCPFCQNHSLSQALRAGDQANSREREWSPDDVVRAAEAERSGSISFTYSEPVLSFEFALDVAAAARPKGLDLIFVTNGQVNEEPAREMARFLSAANVDLKCGEASKYRDPLGGSLEATVRTIAILAGAGVLVEVTTLVVPGFNDSEPELREIARIILDVSADIPWHVSRFHPDFRWLDRPSTPEATLRQARQIGLEQGLRFVYVGNLAGRDGENTYCPGCGGAVIERRGYQIVRTATSGGSCIACGTAIHGRGLP